MSKIAGKNAPLPGLIVFQLPRFADERGWFQEKFQKNKLAAAGLPAGFAPIQQNISYNAKKGVTRGFHAEPWDKYVSCVKGRVWAAFLDLRRPGFGQVHSLEIGPDQAVFVPKGVANSFQTLEDETYYSYLVNGEWSAGQAAGYKSVNLADPDLAVPWPIPLSQGIVSEKDRNHPPLKSVEPFDL